MKVVSPVLHLNVITFIISTFIVDPFEAAVPRNSVTLHSYLHHQPKLLYLILQNIGIVVSHYDLR
jgi:hypothetical protein